MLQLILQVGNFLNEGTMHGNCQGFRISDLEKLAACKTSDNQSNLLEAVVQLALQRDQEMLNFTKEMDSIRQVCPHGTGASIPILYPRPYVLGPNSEGAGGWQ